MIIIKILVENELEKDIIVALLAEAEEEGEIDFSFTCKSDDFDEDKEDF